MVPGLDGRCHGCFEGAGQPVDEIFNGRFCNPREQGLVNRPSDQPEGWLIPPAERQLRQLGSQRRELQLRVEHWEKPGRPSGAPGDRDPGLTDTRDGRTNVNLYVLGHPVTVHRKANLGQQVLAPIVGETGNAGDQALGRGQERLLEGCAWVR